MSIMNRCLIAMLASFLCIPLFAGTLQDELKSAAKTLELVESSAKQPALATRLAALRQKVGKQKKSAILLAEIRKLRREIILSHPALNFKKLLINKRPPPLYSHNVDQYLGRHSRAGDGLVVLDDWKTAPKETILLKDKLPEGSVLHPDLSCDGKNILFSFCDHTEKRKEFRRFWIYEAAADGSSVRQVTGTKSDLLERRNERQTVLIEDFDPAYLPDGGMVFTSTRSQNFGRCHGGRYTPSYLLYRAELDGSKIRQISFGEANELDPSVLPDGRIVYTRWEYINRHDTYFHSLWTTRPDGTGTEHFYGNYTKGPYMLAETRAIPGTRKVMATASAHHSFTAGSTVVIDPAKGLDGPEPLTRLTPDVKFPEFEGYGKGAYVSPYPLTENIFLVAYNPNRHVHQGQVQSIAGYGIYLVYHIDGKAHRELIYSDSEMSSFTPIPLRPRTRPVVIPSRLDLSASKTGIYFVQNIYESQQPFKKGDVAFLRINRILNQPSASHNQRSHVRNENTKQILGTVPVNKDGSVAFRAPAGVPLQLQALDKNGMALLTMRSFIYLHAGEIVSCVGCHESKNTTPAMTRPGLPLKIHDITPPAGPRYDGGFNYIKTVQPVLDRYCISCHGLGNKKKAGSLLGVPVDKTSNRAAITTQGYNYLIKSKGMVKLAVRNEETNFSVQKDYFAHAGKLIPFLDKGHGKVKLDTESRQRIVDWLDVNAQFYGDYSFNRIEIRGVNPGAETALRAYVKELFGAKLATQPLEALVNRAEGSESRILKAPLAISAGGWGQIANGWKSTDDPRYQKMSSLISKVFNPLRYQDINGTCGRDRCICGSCWIRKKLSSQARAVQHRFLAVDESRGQLLYVDQFRPNKSWKVSIPDKGRDIQLIGGKKVLVSTNKGFYVFSLENGKLFEKNLNFNKVMTVRRLPNGNTLVGMNQKGITIIGVRPSGSEILKVNFPKLRNLRVMRLTKDNTLMFGADKLIVEADFKGKVLWQHKLEEGRHIYKAVRLANGNALASAGYGGFLCEVAPDGKVIRKVGGKDNSQGAKLGFFADFHQLNNGNIVVCNWHGHDAKSSSRGEQLLEFDHSGKLIWKYHNPELAGSIHAVIILDDININQFYSETDGTISSQKMPKKKSSKRARKKNEKRKK